MLIKSAPASPMITTMSSEDEELRAAELRVADAIGSLMEFWGFRRAMGRLWTVLYLSDQPVPAAELSERLHMSVGAVSMAVSELQKWGVVRRTWRPGDRRDFYEAETSIWKMVSRVFRERELQMVRQVSEDFVAAEKLLAAAAKRATGDRKRTLKFMSDRMSQLLALARLGEALLGALVSGEPIDPGPIQTFFLGKKS